jgi:diadenylate cyclase
MLDGRLILRAVIDIAVVSYVIYRLILLAKGRRAWWILIGLGVFFLLLLASDYLELVTLNWLLRQVTPLGPIAIVVLFFPELREVLEKLGRAEFWGTPIHVTHHENMTDVIEEVVKAASLLSPLKTGALIVLERETGLDDVIATGKALDAEVSAPLLTTIFHHGTPLHDGAVIIRNGRIAAAECTLPLSDAPNIANANVHMRHRAAIGVSENSDAVVVIVSEETGTISIAINGKLQRGLKPDVLRTKLLEAFGHLPKQKSSSVSLPFVRRRAEEKAP